MHFHNIANLDGMIVYIIAQLYIIHKMKLQYRPVLYIKLDIHVQKPIYSLQISTDCLYHCKMLYNIKLDICIAYPTSSAYIQ